MTQPSPRSTPTDVPTSTYVAAKPPLPETTEELRARIPGWGADLDPADRPAVPRERFAPEATGAHWDFPEQQPEEWPRERSVEHGRLTPVFGTSCPPRGLSGKVRRLAYARYSEARAAHWLLLIAADRVDTAESVLRSFAGRPDDPVTESGVVAELRDGAWRSRFGKGRSDLRHQVLDPVIVAGPWVASAWAGLRVVRRLRQRRA